MRHAITMTPSRPVFLAVLFALGLLLAAGPVRARSIEVLPSPPEKVVDIPTNWELYKGESGLVLAHPPFWRVQEYGPRSPGAFALFQPAQGPAQALVWVEPLRRASSSAEALRTLPHLRPGLFPQAKVEPPTQASAQPDVALARLEYKAGGQRFVGSAMAFVSAGRGVVYVIAAMEPLYARMEADMIGILNHFHYSGPAKAGPPAAQLPAMITWTDPTEHAFSLPVPQGWSVSGGVSRPSPTEVRSEVVAQSPDNRFFLRKQDASIPPFLQPDPFIASMGFTEGKTYSPGYGAQWLIMNYRPGARFITEYYLLKGDIQAEVKETRDRPDLAQRAQANFQKAGLNARVDAGEVFFTARTEWGRRGGYLFCLTSFMPNPGSDSGPWFVNDLYGYLCEPGLETVARTILGHMVGGLVIDPDWHRRHLMGVADRSRIVSDTNEEISRMITQGWEQRQAVQDQGFEDWSRAYRDQVLLRDPTTGEQIEAPNASTYYWRVEGSDAVLGSDGPEAPALPDHFVRELEALR